MLNYLQQDDVADAMHQTTTRRRTAAFVPQASSSVWMGCIIKRPPEGSRTRREPVAAARRRRVWLGHQATQWMGVCRSQERMHRPERTSHTLSSPSSPPDASHCPDESGAMLLTCKSSRRALQHKPRYSMSHAWVTDPHNVLSHRHADAGPKASCAADHFHQ